MNLIKNVKKVEYTNINDFKNKVRRTSRMTICLTAFGVFLMSGSQKINTIHAIDNERTLGHCSLEVEEKTASLKDLYILKAKELISNLSSDEKKYIKDEIIVDYINELINYDSNFMFENNIFEDETDGFMKEIDIITLEVINYPNKYEEVYDSIYSDNIEEYLGEYKLTGYCPCEKCCGSNSHKTASGAIPKSNHTIAADKSIPFGTKLLINGTIYTVEDVGSGVNGKHIDVFYDTHEEAIKNGTKYAKVYLLKEDNVKRMK